MSKSRGYNSAKEEFLDYYCQILPQYTPETLEKYLSVRNPPILLVSPLHASDIQKLWAKAHLSYVPLDWFPSAVYWPSEAQLGTSLPGFLEGWLYAMNPSSLFPVLALGLKAGDSVLDASAAPGGKTLAMVNSLSPSHPDILANDVSFPRFKRLKTVLKLYGYPDIPALCHPIQALQYKLQPASFDKILLDAPCSSEKHVFNSKKHLKIWRPNRSLNLSHLQSLLLESLIPLLKPQGHLVYSTCSINPQENQDVINTILSKNPSLSQITFSNPVVLNMDPMFVAKLIKS